MDSIPEAPHPQTELRRLLVEIACTSLQLWSIHTGRSKLDLVLACGLWSQGSERSSNLTRTFNRYLSLKTLPRRPHTEDILRIAYFVLQQTPAADAPLLEQQLDHFLLLQESLSLQPRTHAA
jgi:two-component system sensor histidine kinase ChiS